ILPDSSYLIVLLIAKVWKFRGEIYPAPMELHSLSKRNSPVDPCNALEWSSGETSGDHIEEATIRDAFCMYLICDLKEQKTAKNHQVLSDLGCFHSCDCLIE
ncbi:transmembrane protein 74, partial [Mus musculus]